MSSNPFDFVNSITYDKKDIMLNNGDDASEKQYNSYIVNHALSYYPDTVGFANEMNLHPHTSNKMKYLFLLNTIRKQKRFSKWLKPEMAEGIEAVKAYYGYSNEKARQALTLLNDEQIEILKQKVYKGGRK